MCNPHVLSKSCMTSVGFAKLIAQGDKPYLFFEVAMRAVPHSSVLFFTASIGVASIVLLGTALDAALAQTPVGSASGQVGVKTMFQVNEIFVNPSVGDDKVGNGGERTPLKTITQALRLASPNTVIMLSKGTYSAETGERFPLMLKPDVSIQGDQGSKGRDIVIQGGGEYLSRTFGGKNVTIVGANSAGLTGVTVTNTNPRGYGLWIEYSSPAVVENTFTGSTQDGIAVTGNSQPSIRKNYFYRNGANGITISGNSRPQVRENVFQQTGFGINIAENAAPRLVGNQIKDNRSGIIVQAHAHPILRSNLIQDSKEDGLVAIAQATPDLGSASEPGANEFRNNSRYDINASASQQIIAAYGNTLQGDRINGKVDTNATGTLAQNPQPAAIPYNSTSANRRITSVLRNSITQNNSGSEQLNSQLPRQSAALPVSLTTVNPQQSTDRSAGFPTPNSLTRYGGQPLSTKRANMREFAPTAKTTAEKPNIPQFNYVQVSPNTIEFTAPQSAVNPQRAAPLQRASSLDQPLPQRSAPLQRASGLDQPLPQRSAPLQRTSSIGQPLPVLEAASVGNTDLLPVPDSNVPRGNTSNMQKVPVPQTATVGYGGGSTQLATSAAQIDLRFRVVVEAGTEQEQQIVKFLAPGAFRTVWHGREVMQVGVFSSRYNANNMVKILNQKGLRPVVEPIN